MSKPCHCTLVVGDLSLPYELSLSHRRSVSIRVMPDLRVLVAAPAGSDLRIINQILLQRAAWILKQQEYFRHRQVTIFPKRFAPGETCYFLGNPYQVRPVRQKIGTEGVNIEGNDLTVTLRGSQDSARIHALVEAWYRIQARVVFEERFSAWFPAFAGMGLAQPEIALRWMRTRWGTCSSRGKITLNTHLVMVPAQLVDYVIVHELCHLKEHNHGPGFHRLLAGFFPDWKEHRKQLGRFIIQ